MSALRGAIRICKGAGGVALRPGGVMIRRTSPLKAAAVRLADRRTGFLLLAALLGLAAASLYASSAASPVPQDGVTIPYGDLDLSTISGATELERRLVEAADAVCADLDSPAVPQDALERCRMDAVSGAILILRRPPAAVAVVSS